MNAVAKRARSNFLCAFRLLFHTLFFEWPVDSLLVWLRGRIRWFLYGKCVPGEFVAWLWGFLIFEKIYLRREMRWNHKHTLRTVMICHIPSNSKPTDDILDIYQMRTVWYGAYILSAQQSPSRPTFKGTQIEYGRGQKNGDAWSYLLQLAWCHGNLPFVKAISFWAPLKSRATANHRHFDRSWNRIRRTPPNLSHVVRVSF